MTHKSDGRTRYLSRQNMRSLSNKQAAADSMASRQLSRRGTRGVPLLARDASVAADHFGARVLLSLARPRWPAVGRPRGRCA